MSSNRRLHCPSNSSARPKSRQKALAMADVQIAIWLWGKARYDFFVFAIFYVFANNFSDKIRWCVFGCCHFKTFWVLVVGPPLGDHRGSPLRGITHHTSYFLLHSSPVLLPDPEAHLCDHFHVAISSLSVHWPGRAIPRSAVWGCRLNPHR